MPAAFSKERITGILEQMKDGRTVSQICRDNNVSPAAFYRWKAKFGEMDSDEAKRIHELELEIAGLKRKITNLKRSNECQALDLVALQDLLAKN